MAGCLPPTDLTCRAIADKRGPLSCLFWWCTALSQQLSRLTGPLSPADRKPHVNEGPRESLKAARLAWVRKKSGLMRDHIKRALGLADLYELPPGAELQQQSSAVLLRGALEVVAAPMAGQPMDALRKLTLAGRHARNSVIPWVWEVLTADDLAASSGEHVGMRVDQPGA